MQKILIIEDEKTIVDIIKFHLIKSGYSVLEAYDGLSGLACAEKERPDLILLDVMMPGMNGYEVCSKLRTQMTTPIIMLTALEEVTDKILGLSLGADDYICKPFHIREVLARIDANLRRVAMQTIQPAEKIYKVFGNLEVSLENYEVKVDGALIELTTREYELLSFFVEYPEKVFTREALLSKVWHFEYFGEMRTVDVTISRLREKIESDSEKHIITKRGFGYFFR